MQRAVPVFALLLAGCSQPAPSSSAEIDINGAAERAKGDIATYSSNVATTASANDALPLTPAGPGQPGGLPDDDTPVSEAPAAADSPQAAANIIQTYYALLGEGKYRQAWALWGDKGGESGMSANALAASFAKYREYHANVGGPGDVDAGAGQRYVTVPVQVYGRLKAGGQPFYMRGEAVLHRVGDIDGATPDQKSWHIKSIDLRPASGKPTAKAAASNAPSIAAARYRCMDGNKLAVRFDNAAGTATVSRAGKPLAVLTQQKAASGIWYGKGPWSLRSKGDAATFTAPGQPPIACTAIR